MATLSERADALEHTMSEELDRKIASKSVLFTSGEMDPTKPRPPIERREGQHMLMGPDPRLPKMPEKPTLMDFYKYRFGPANHMLQSALLARNNGCPEKIILACLLHDIGIIGFIKSDHGYWAAQLVEPYVDEEVAWMIRYHQVLRFFPDHSVGYEYPELYLNMLGQDYTPDPHTHRAYEKAKKHKWYMSARLLTLNDLYAFDPNVNPALEDFTDIIERNFRQPEEGLGFDDSPTSHMWRTINMPTRAL